MSVPREAVAVALAVGLIAPVLAAAQRQVPGAFRGRVVLVPVDVRVLDPDGNPVTDLRQADFTVFEDSVPQPIGHFSTQAFAEVTADDIVPGPMLRRAPGLEPSPVQRRTFLIVLGRGRLQAPANGMDAIVDLVRNRLLPHDFVGVMAYNRTSDLTADRGRVLTLLERYRERHEAIETRLDEYFHDDSLMARYGDRAIPPGIQAEVDRIFDSQVLGTRELPSPPTKALREIEEEWRRGDDLDDRYAVSIPSAGHVTVQTQHDVEKLYAAIEYLRYVEGEKHLIFISEEALAGLRRPERHDSLAAAAADARVTLSTVQTGGLGDRLAGLAGAEGGSPRFIPGLAFAHRDAAAVAEMTGGVSSYYQYAAKGLDRLERATRFHYLIGYYPSNQDWNGDLRRIEVRVNRRDVTLSHRRGYFARDELVPYDRRRFLSHARIMAAGVYDRRYLQDIQVSISARVVTDDAGARRLQAEIAIKPVGVTFEPVNGRFVARLNVAVFAGGRDDQLVGEHWEQLDLNLDAATHARLTRESIVYTATVPLSGVARRVRAVVYDYTGDRLGMMTQTVR
jgi:VWFA-related protein